MGNRRKRKAAAAPNLAHVGMTLALATFHGDGSIVIEHWQTLTAARADTIRRVMGPPTASSLADQTNLLRAGLEADAITVEEPPGAPKPKPLPRFDADGVPPFDPATAEHFWVLQCWDAIDADAIRATEAGEAIIRGGATVRVSHIFCAYCFQALNDARAEPCPGAAVDPTR